MAEKSAARRFFADWPAKVLSFVIALLLFFAYRLNRLEERYFSVPLEIRVDQSLAVATPVPHSVRITLRGESSGIFSILEDDVAAVADLSAIRVEGPARAAVRVELRGSALGVSPLEIAADPPELSLSLDRRLTRLVPVTPSFKGYLAPGYELASFGVTPPEVEVSGPAGAVASLADVGTDFIELAGRTADFSSRVRLLPRDGLFSVVGASEVEFTALVRPSLGMRTWEGLAVTVEGLPAGLALEGEAPVASLRVRTSGGEGLDFVPGPEALAVDARGVDRPGSWTLPVAATLPEGVALDAVSPESVTIRVVEAAPGGEGRTP